MMLAPIDIVAWSFFGIVVVAYHVVTYTNVLVRHSRTTQLSWMLASNPAWIAKMLRTKSSEVAAVQALRNTIIVSTFVGGFAFTNASLYVDALDTCGAGDGALNNTQVRVLVLAILLYVAFLNFALVVRSSAQVGYLITTAVGQAETDAAAAADVEHARPVTQPAGMSQDISLVSEKMLRSVTLHFSLGFRMFYVAIPVALYAAGAPVFIGATALLLLWLLYVDHGAMLM